MNNEFDYIRCNCERINERITAAALRAGRSREDIKLIAVSKTIDAAIVKKVLEYGITDLGENRVQELCDKADIIDMTCNWHLIGHLQTNKVKHIIDKVAMIHSLDSLELAAEIQKRAEKAAKHMEVLVQVNIAAEDSKFGIKPEETLGFIKGLAKMGNIKVKGLMTIAPLAENPEDVRWVFAGLRKLLIDISKENIDNIDMDYLSMGMTNDFEVAIEEGSSIVRIGTAIFGKRN
jgi:pyridoxal phosphate enzyme (YggS family)